STTAPSTTGEFEPHPSSSQSPPPFPHRPRNQQRNSSVQNPVVVAAPYRTTAGAGAGAAGSSIVAPSTMGEFPLHPNSSPQPPPPLHRPRNQQRNSSVQNPVVAAAPSRSTVGSGAGAAGSSIVAPSTMGEFMPHPNSSQSPPPCGQHRPTNQQRNSSVQNPVVAAAPSRTPAGSGEGAADSSIAAPSTMGEFPPHPNSSQSPPPFDRHQPS